LPQAGARPYLWPPAAPAGAAHTLPMPTKAALRRAALAHRRDLEPGEVALRSARLGEQLFGHFPVAEWRGLHVFLPLARRNEPDTWPIIRRIWAEFPAVRLAAPVVQVDGISLINYMLHPTTQLLENRWGIAEPVADLTTEMPPAAFDAVLVPLLAVDETGQRVGYGGGFYDRFLARCRPGTQFIGLNVLDEPPAGHIADVLPTDVPLTAYLTPGGVWRF
jgi:5-formyltetrahydrofolate cyclo-ligase